MRRSLRSATVAIGALVVTLGSVMPAGAVAGFGDVAGDEFYTEAVQWMVDNDITSGTSPGCFSPGTATTRGQVATFIHRVQGEPAGGDSGFVDVAPGAYYADAVGWMVEDGITTGTTPMTFAPDRLVTRGELATFLYRAAGSPASGSESFVDVAATDFFADAVGWMVAEGITTGTSATTFSPSRYVTRGEVAAFLYRAAGSPDVDVIAGGDCATAAAEVELAVAEAQSFNRLNELRAGLGLAPLVRLASMDADARDWSRTMDVTGDFHHSDLPYGENIAWWSAGYASPEAAADKMHELWVNSPGHYANMTNPHYTAVGVGFWRSDSGGWHATHVFAS
ncbi:MAG: S-layer homology domain-containing protein [Acidimicrobiales bacterium]